MSKELELGQLTFGNPTGEFGTPEFADALIEYLLKEIGIVYWNKYQNDWDRTEDPNLEGVEFNDYYWAEDEKEKNKPNLKFKGLKQEIRWYKYPGRGQSCKIDYTEKEWNKWFTEALKIIRKNDIKI